MSTTAFTIINIKISIITAILHVTDIANDFQSIYQHLSLPYSKLLRLLPLEAEFRN